jgi:colanic acid biosynthesis glycosyl transferase WcaI
VPANTQVAHIIGPAGLIVSPEDPEALASAIRVLAGDAAHRKIMGNAALAVAQKTFEIENVLGRIEARLKLEINSMVERTIES